MSLFFFKVQPTTVMVPYVAYLEADKMSTYRTMIYTSQEIQKPKMC